MLCPSSAYAITPERAEEFLLYVHREALGCCSTSGSDGVVVFSGAAFLHWIQEYFQEDTQQAQERGQQFAAGEWIVPNELAQSGGRRFSSLDLYRIHPDHLNPPTEQNLRHTVEYDLEEAMSAARGLKGFLRPSSFSGKRIVSRIASHFSIPTEKAIQICQDLHGRHLLVPTSQGSSTSFLGDKTQYHIMSRTSLCVPAKEKDTRPKRINSVEEILADKHLLKLFVRFCQANLNQENINFLIEVAKWKKAPAKEQNKRAHRIVREFIGPSSVTPLNLDDDVVEPLLEKVAQQGEDLSSLFDRAELNIRHLILLDTLPKFNQSRMDPSGTDSPQGRRRKSNQLTVPVWPTLSRARSKSFSGSL